MRNRFFTKQEARYIALKDLTGEGKYRRDDDRTVSVGSATDDSLISYTPSFKKRMSDAFARRRRRRLSLTASSSAGSATTTTQWKRASLSRAMSALNLHRRDSRREGQVDEDVDTDSSDDEEDSAETRDDFIKKRLSLIQTWMTTPAPSFGTSFTTRHSTLFVPVSV
ncbi:hypothetical protein BBO_02871 [Beauveria brongniartii RCEF 3172]|uniref:Uncharacterized protein n=1 Tax=Beauveria brongniartii RCEF 3172 TaxID=1081107 RepID=A0A167H2U9_9HYPO|nr:hypothetical protein BBO_02871 [Beauveria brongniartii RCEF 3172]